MLLKKKIVVIGNAIKSKKRANLETKVVRKKRNMKEIENINIDIDKDHNQVQIAICLKLNLINTKEKMIK